MNFTTTEPHVPAGKRKADGLSCMDADKPVGCILIIIGIITRATVAALSV